MQADAIDVDELMIETSWIVGVRGHILNSLYGHLFFS
jgi:hypothetical protein